jgi:CRP-like cAMP-binding protein
VEADQHTRGVAFVEHAVAGVSLAVRGAVERLALRSVRERLLHWVLAEGAGGRIALRTTRKELAAELGVTHEALYRTLAALARAGELVDEGDALRLK